MTLKYGAVLILLALFASPPLASQIHWESLSAPDWWESYKHLADDEFVMATADSMYLSRDAGRSWSTIALPAVQGDIVEWDWIRGGRGLLLYVDAQAVHQVTLAWTDDFGASWDVRSFPQTERLAVHPQAAFTSVCRMSDSLMFCTIQNRLFRSTDRGGNFQELGSPMIPYKTIRFGPNSAWLVGSLAGRLGVSTDAGMSWSDRALPDSVHRVSVDFSERTVVTGALHPNSVFASAPGGSDLLRIPVPDDAYMVTVAPDKTTFVAVDDDRYWLFVRSDWSGTQRVYVTTDGGAHWTWHAADRHVMDAWPLSDNEALVIGDDAELYRMSFPADVPFVVAAQDLSTRQSLYVVVTWTDPGGGVYTDAIIERSAADSIWVHAATVTAPDRFYIDRDLPSTAALRYRVTMNSSTGSFRQYSDAVTPERGKYLDLSRTIIPDGGATLRYRHRRVSTIGSVVQYDSTVEVLYTFQQPVDSTRWIRVQGIGKRIVHTGGGYVESVDRILEYRGEQARFSYSHAGGIATFGYQGLDRVLEFRNSGDALLGSVEPPFPVFAPSTLLSDPDSDTVRFVSSGATIFGEGPTFRITAAYGAGITAAFGITRSRSVVVYDTLTLLEAVSAIQETSLPTRVQILQNHPNPFAASTTIRFILPSAAHVRLSIHDQLGREVAVPVDAMREAGEHTLRFDAGNLRTGMYLCRLQTNAGSHSVIMVRVR